MPGNATINGLHAFNGHPAEFWPEFSAFACKEAHASNCILVRQRETAWEVFYRWPSARPVQSPDLNFSFIERIANEAFTNGTSFVDASETNSSTIGLRLEESVHSHPCVAIFFIEPEIDCSCALPKLQLLADVPAVYQRFRSAKQAEADMASLADTLDLLLLLNSEKKHLAMAMTLVNEVSARYKCSRVSLGWIDAGFVRATAISQLESFDRKMEIVSSLEAAMQETFDQDEEVLTPPRQPEGAVSREHDEYSRRYDVANLLSLPLRINGEPVGVLTCERQQGSFTQHDIEKLRILCDQVAVPLQNSREQDRSMLTRIKDEIRERLSGLLGVEHTFAKFFAVAAFCLLVLAAIIKVPYRVEAPFILRSEDVRQVSTPFEGFIDEVDVKIGQLVKKGDQLLTLDSRELRLQESAALANQVRFLREIEKARASGSLVDMKIAQAQANQASAHLDLVRHKLSLAELRAPIDGIIVEGDLEQLRGSPVEAGDILFKIARHELLFIEAKIEEEDIHELAIGQTGEFAFVSRPHLKYPFHLDLIDPVAIAEDKSNVFLARGRDLKNHEPWWRPGMSGIAKVDVGKRSILWIATHRTIDFFQMLMWW